jgi:Secretion system C-terminal sorting domain/Concanavalin A-like lectin/glucanases superfamily
MKKIYIACLALGLAITANAQIPTNGLLHQFRFSGNLNNGVVGATKLVTDTFEYCAGTNIANLPPRYAPDRFGTPNRAYSFYGKDSALYPICFGVVDSSKIWRSNSLKSLNTIALGSADRTIAFWAKLPQVDYTNVFRFHTSNSPAPKTAFGLDLKNTSQNQVTAYTWGGGNDIDYNTTLDTNWHFYLMSVENSELKLSIDKVVVDSLTITGLNTATGNLYLGSIGDIPNLLLDNFVIYNRILSTTEIDQVYADTSVGCLLEVTYSAYATNVQFYVTGITGNSCTINITNPTTNQLLGSSTSAGGAFTTYSPLTPIFSPYNSIAAKYTITDGNGCILEGYLPLGPSAINEVSNNQILLYPNPAANTIYFDNARVSINGNYSITSIDGKQVAFGKILQHQINIATLQPGIYFLQIKDGHNTFSSKFTKL